MLQLERGMWPGARAGDTPAGVSPHTQLPDARAAAFHAAPPLPSPALPRDIAADPRSDVSVDVRNVPSSSRDSMPAALLMASQGDGQDIPAAGMSQAPLHSILLATAQEPEVTASFAVTTNRSRPASNDHVMISGEQAGGAIVLRFDAPLEQRKALLEAVTNELRRRGLPLRPIIINGTIHAGSQGGHS